MNNPGAGGAQASFSADGVNAGRGFDLTVLQVLPALDAGGVERGAVDVASAIVAAGGKAIVVSSGGRMEAELTRIGAQHVRMPVNRKTVRHMWRNAGRLAKLIRREKVDIIHARSRAPAWSARRAARRTGIPFVTTFHGIYNFGNPLKKKWNRIMASGDRVIAISTYVAEHIAAQYRVPEERIRTIHRGVDTERFNPAAVPPARIVQLVEAWRVPDGAQVVMLPARLSRWKGHAVLIEALSLMDCTGLTVVFVGSNERREAYGEELVRQTKKLGLEGVVRFVGHCSDMPAAYKLADVVVNASTDPEGFGRVIAEAGAMGRPVIATDHGGARETVIPGATGWLTPPGDASALAQALMTALSLTKEERHRLAQSAASNIRQNFSKQTMTRQTLDVYGELMRETRHRRAA